MFERVTCPLKLMTRDTFEYALESTRVLLSPKRKIDTFGDSILHYYLLTEDMDAVNLSRVREGRIEALRPVIITPQNMGKLLLEGFGEKARDFAEWLQRQPQFVGMLRYGFSVRKDELQTYDVHESLETLAPRMQEIAESRNNSLSAVLVGVESGWEVSLLKFMMDYVMASAPGNIDDFRRRGLIP